MRCACSWFCQKSPAAAFMSSSVRRRRSFAGSKKAPHERDARAELFVAVFEVFEDHLSAAELHFRTSAAKIRNQERRRNHNAEPGQPIAEASVESEVAAGGVWREEMIAHVGGKLGDDAAVRIDGRGVTVIGAA